MPQGSPVTYYQKVFVHPPRIAKLVALKDDILTSVRTHLLTHRLVWYYALMTRPASSFMPFLISLAAYGLLLFLLNQVSSTWEIPALSILPIVLAGMLIYIVTVPRKRLFAFSLLLLILSVLAAPVLLAIFYFVIGGCCGAPSPSDSEQLAIASCLLVPVFGIGQFIYFKIRKNA